MGAGGDRPLYVVVRAVLFRSRIGNPSYGAMLSGVERWPGSRSCSSRWPWRSTTSAATTSPSGSVWEIAAAVAVSLSSRRSSRSRWASTRPRGVSSASWCRSSPRYCWPSWSGPASRRDRQAWRGWAFAVVGWLVPAVALVLSRVGIFGVSVAQQPMYFLLPVTLATLGALLAWSPTQPTQPPQLANPPQPTQARLPLRRRWVAVVTVVLLGVGYVLSGPVVVNTLFTYALGKYGTPHPDYVDRLLASGTSSPGTCLQRARRGRPGSLVPDVLPPTTGSAPCWTCMRRT